MTVNEWVRNVCEAALPQHHLAIETSELNWLSLLKLEPWDTFLPNTMVLHFSLHFLGGKCSFWRWLLKINEDLCGVAYFCLIYIYIPLLWVFFFWCILLWIPACLELIFLSFFFFKKRSLSGRFFSVCSFKESPDFGTSRYNHTVEKQLESSQGGFCCIFLCY